MAFRVAWTETAWQDLSEVADYIARDSRFYAASFVTEVRSAARTFGVFPGRGRIVPELGDPNIREIFVSRYRLIYKVIADAVYIIAFVHGARDLLAVWHRS